MSAESEIGLKIYDGCYKAIAASVATMDQRGRDLFLEHHLAAVVAATRHFCPGRADGFFRAACLDVRAERKAAPLPRWRQVALAVVMVPLRHWLVALLVFWIVAIWTAAFVWWRS